MSYNSGFCENLFSSKHQGITNNSFSQSSILSKYFSSDDVLICNNQHSRSMPSATLVNKLDETQLQPLKIFHQNVQHLSSRLNILKINLEEIQPDIIAITEHKMSKVEISFLNIQNYSVCSYYSRCHSLGGGVMILAGKNIKSKQIIIPAVQELITEKEFECCLSEITVNHFSFVMACIYRSPQQCFLEPFLDKFDILCEILNNKFRNIIIAGDFNINVLIKNKAYHAFINILNSYDFEYKVDFPTRVTAETETAIDNFVSNIKCKKLKISGLITQISDHDGQLLEILGIKNISQLVNKKYSRKFSSTNISLFLKMLAGENWQGVYQATVEAKYDVFHSIFAHAFEISFPKLLVLEKRSNFNEWISDDIKNKKTKIVELEKLYRTIKTDTLKHEIKESKLEVKIQSNREKKHFFDNKILKSNNKSRATWGIIKSEINNKPTGRDDITILHSGKLVTDPLLVGNIFNDFFINAVDNLIMLNTQQSSVGDSPTNNSSNMLNIFKFKEIDELQLHKIVMAFENKFSTGIDDIPISIVKQSISLICKPLTHIINSSLISGFFPCKLKVAKVIPVFKRGNRNDSTSYRPISLLPVFSKLFEKVVYYQLSEFLEDNKVLDGEQHGFRSKKSTITAGINFIESIIDSVDKDENVVGVFLDLTKAFDSVSHEKLLNKLNILNIKGKEHKWFSSYLKNRLQCVEIQHTFKYASSKYRYIQNVLSEFQVVKYGVPQGSILGPLLFLCYLNGLPKVIPKGGSICLYADDANITVSGKNKNDIELVSFLSLLSVKEFLDEKNLLINTSKSNFISFSTKQKRSTFQPDLFIDTSKLSQVDVTKFLGLILDPNLGWDKHVDHVVSKMSSGLYALRQMTRICSIETLKTIYFSLINSHMSYGIAIYGATSKKNLDRILLQQKKAVRIIFNLQRRQSVREYFSQLGILTVYSLYIFETIMYIKNYQLAITSTVHHNYNTRINRDVEQHRLQFFEKKASFIGKKFLFALPNVIIQESNLNKFKMLLKDFLLNLSLYSIQEYWDMGNL